VVTVVRVEGEVAVGSTDEPRSTVERPATQHTAIIARRWTYRVTNYLQHNRDRMRYDEYLAVGFPIASGVIEGGGRSTS